MFGIRGMEIIERLSPGIDAETLRGGEKRFMRIWPTAPTTSPSTLAEASRLRICAGGLLLGIVTAVFAQEAPAPRAFEVASVKVHATPLVRMAISTSGPRWTAEGENARALILYGYDVKNYQVKGPPEFFTPDTRYDILAKAAGEGAPSKDEFREMVRALLADRFKLQLHRERRALPVYFLEVARSGPKLKKSVAEPGAVSHMGPRGRNEDDFIPHATMADLAGALGNSSGLSRPVLDKTGIAGIYDINLTFTSEYTLHRTVDAADTDVSIFAALQDQLGLRLVEGTEEMEVLVVDRLARAAEN